MKRTRLKAKDFNKELEAANYELKFSKKDSIERIESKDNNLKIISVNKLAAFFYIQGKLIPTIKFLHKNPSINILKKITVDMGAIKFVAGGADIMRPGITLIDPNIKQEEIVAIIDEKNKMVISIGMALSNSNDMQVQKNGKSAKNIHYISDEIWNFI